MHEFPEGIVTYVLLLKGGLREKMAFWLTDLARGRFASSRFCTEVGTSLGTALGRDCNGNRSAGLRRRTGRRCYHSRDQDRNRDTCYPG